MVIDTTITVSGKLNKKNVDNLIPDYEKLHGRCISVTNGKRTITGVWVHYWFNITTDINGIPDGVKETGAFKFV